MQEEIIGTHNLRSVTDSNASQFKFWGIKTCIFFFFFYSQVESVSKVLLKLPSLKDNRTHILTSQAFKGVHDL